jgi:hypothetical protein
VKGVVRTGAATTCVLLGVLAGAATTGQSSGADFTAATANPGGTITADNPTRYAHGYSQSTDPTGLTGYAVKTAGVPAATGSDATLVADVGSYKNANNTTVTRLVVVAVPASLPVGVTSVTVKTSLSADPTTGKQPIVSAVFAAANGAGTCSGTTVTLSAGQRCQVDIVINTRVPNGFVNNSVYVPTLYLIVNLPGYTGSSFLDFPVPVTVSTS